MGTMRWFLIKWESGRAEIASKFYENKDDAILEYNNRTTAEDEVGLEVCETVLSW